MDHPKLKTELLLNLAVRACNDKLGSEAVVPPVLVFLEN